MSDFLLLFNIFDAPTIIGGKNLRYEGCLCVLVCLLILKIQVITVFLCPTWLVLRRTFNQKKIVTVFLHEFCIIYLTDGIGDAPTIKLNRDKIVMTMVMMMIWSACYIICLHLETIL